MENLKSKNQLIFGVGINDAEYSVAKHGYEEGKRKRIWTCPFYTVWHSMLRRCYCEAYQVKFPAYRGCTVVEEWLYFTKFRSWMIQQDWEGKSLDKDLLIYGNKVYGPDACVFIESKINNFMIERKTFRPDGLIGTSYHKATGKYHAACKDVVTLKNTYIGVYDTPEEAHQAWLTFKLEQAKILASQQTDSRIAKALVDRYENYGLQRSSV